MSSLRQTSPKTCEILKLSENKCPPPYLCILLLPGTSSELSKSNAIAVRRQPQNANLGRKISTTRQAEFNSTGDPKVFPWLLSSGFSLEPHVNPAGTQDVISHSGWADPSSLNRNNSAHFSFSSLGSLLRRFRVSCLSGFLRHCAPLDPRNLRSKSSGPSGRSLGVESPFLASGRLCFSQQRGEKDQCFRFTPHCSRWSGQTSKSCDLVGFEFQTPLNRSGQK